MMPSPTKALNNTSRITTMHQPCHYQDYKEVLLRSRVRGVGMVLPSNYLPVIPTHVIYSVAALVVVQGGFRSIVGCLDKQSTR